MFRRTYFSEADGGGGITADTGIAPDTMIADGSIIAGIRPGIKNFLPIGDIVTATAFGAGVPGTRITSTTARRAILPGGVNLPDAPRAIRAAGLRADTLPAGVPAAGRAAVLPQAADTPRVHRIYRESRCRRHSGMALDRLS